MTKLTRLLKELEAANHDTSDTSMIRFDRAVHELAWHTFRLWKYGRIDSEKLTLAKKGASND